MKFVLSPVHEVSEEEREILLQFQSALDSACREVMECDLCPLEEFCRHYADAPQVLEELVDILKI